MIKKLLFLAVCSCAALFTSAQTVSLFAGSPYTITNDWYGYSGNTSSILANKDSFAMPWGICTDTAGRFWISDITKMYVVTGGYSIVRGGYTGNPQDPGAQDYQDKTGTVSRFSQPHGVCVHPKSNDVYVCDYGNNVIRKGLKYVNVSNPSIWSTLAGVQSFVIGEYKDGAALSAKFNGPEDIVVSSDGSTFYVSDQGNHCIRKINGGNVSTVCGDTIEGDKLATGKSARFSYPSGLFLENDNSLLVCDRNNGKIKRVNLSTGAVTNVVSGLFLPTDVVSVNGILYITDRNCIRTWDGTKLRLYAGKYGVSGYVNGNDSTARFADLEHICYDAKTKSLYVSDMGNNVFRKIPVIALPTADFWANKTSVYVNDVVTLHNSSTNATSYQWTISPGSYTLENGGKLTDSMLYVSFSATGSYTITLKASNQAGSDTKVKTSYINVSTQGGVKPTAEFYANKTVCTTADTVTMIEQSTNSPTSWSWSFAPTTVTYLSGTTSSSRFPKVKFTAAGVYSVTLTATNGTGNNVKTRTNYINVTAAGVEDIKTIQVSAFPNPATNQITFSIVPKNTVYVNGLNGAIIELNCNLGMADISNLAAGVYFARFEGLDGKYYSAKFVKIAD